MTIETEESTLVRTTKGRQSSFMWCPACRRQVEMATPELVAKIAGVSTRTIYRWVEAGKLHFDEVPDRTMLICLDSLNTAGAADKSSWHSSSHGG